MKKTERFFPKWISGCVFYVSVIAVLLSAVACRKQAGVESSKKVAAAPPVEAKGPIISMMMASSIDAKGRAVNPRFNFPQKEPQITAIVRVGKIAGSPLNVAWYKTSDDSDEKLFEHQIQVKSNDRAFSVGKNPGKALAAGTYKVVATLEGQTQEMNWDVTPQKPVASNDRASSSGETPDQTRVPGPYQMIALIDSAQTSPNPTATPAGFSTADGQPPVAGSSGTLPPIGTASDICIGGGDDDMCGPEILDSTAPFVDLYVHNGSDQVVNVRGALTQGSAVAEDQLSPVGTIAPAHSQEFLYDPCYYFPSSDLPGAKFRFFVSTTSTVVTLGNDTSDPTVKVISTPARGTKVRAGDKINLKVTANEQRSGGSWQTGVKVIQITAEPGGLVKDPWVNPSNLPKACDDKTWEQKDEATYTVPKNPPLIIKICVIAEDYAGNQGVKCGEFPTGDVWKGTMHTEAQASFDPGRANAYSCSSAFDATLRLVIARGEISGEGRAVYASSTCNFAAVPRCDSILFKLQGRAFSDRLEIHFVFTELVPPKCVNMGFASAYFMGQTVTIPITAPGVAEGQITSSDNPDAVSHYNTTDTIHLKCETCATQ